MCGVVGAVSLYNKSVQTHKLESFLKKISHRGNDDSGYLLFHTGLHHASKVSFYQAFNDEEFASLTPNLQTFQSYESQNEIKSHDWDIFLGHRRLAILDTSPLAHQPMGDLSKNLWLSYNGEIYNFKEIRETLKNLGHKFLTQSDTEVIIYAYAEWGISCVQRFNGMFAFALYDNFLKKLFLVRDRYGIKPLYYALDNSGDLIFASENKAIVEYNNNLKELDYEALLEYFTFQNIFTNKTLFKEVKILESGCFLEVDLNTKKIQKKQYWDFCFNNEVSMNEKDCIEELNYLFDKAIQRQLVSDVEVGSYLSGGIDSGSVCGVASKYLPFLNTFTIGFDLTTAKGIEMGFDERNVSEYLSYLFKTEHYEMVLKSGDMERCLSNFTYHLEEPRVGQSYPNYYASKLASKFVKVVLSGCGGDELFAGYPWRYYRAMESTNFEDYVDKYYLFWQRLLPNAELKKLFSPIQNKVSSVWTRDIFKQVLMGNKAEIKTKQDYINSSLYFEAKTFLHGLLVVEDKLSMAHTLETRVPFLDNDLVDFAQKIPLSFKLEKLDSIKQINENSLKDKRNAYHLKSNDGKMIFRKMISSFMPQEVVEAIKQGFSSPDSSWFEGESIKFVKDRLFDKRAMIYNYFDYETCCKLVQEHLDGKQNRRLFIWSLLNFNEWCNLNLGEQNENF